MCFQKFIGLIIFVIHNIFSPRRSLSNTYVFLRCIVVARNAGCLIFNRLISSSGARKIISSVSIACKQRSLIRIYARTILCNRLIDVMYILPKQTFYSFTFRLALGGLVRRGDDLCTLRVIDSGCSRALGSEAL